MYLHEIEYVSAWYVRLKIYTTWIDTFWTNTKRRKTYYTYLFLLFAIFYFFNEYEQNWTNSVVEIFERKMKEDIMIAGLMDATPGHQPLGYKWRD